MPGPPLGLSSAQAARLQESFRLLQGGAPAQALEIARAVAAAAPNAADAQHALALCLAATGAPQPAEQAFRQSLALAPGNPVINLNFAKFLRGLGRQEECLETLEKAAGVAPQAVEVWTELGVVALKSGKASRAVAALERAVSQRPDAVRAWHALGNARRADGDLEGAESAFRKVVALAPRNGSAWVNLGVVLRLLGRPAEALPCLEAAREAGFSGPELLDAEAGTLTDVGEFEAAALRARALTRQFPEYLDGQMLLAHLLWEYGGALAPDEDPLATFRAAARKQPNHRRLQVGLVCMLLETRQAAEALDLVRELRAHDDHPALIAREADALELLGRHDEAARRFEQACAVFGGDPAFLNAYTRHLLKAGRWKEAASRAEEATRSDPRDQEAWAYLGTAWRLTGDPREDWLCDYDRLVDLVEVDPPQGFARTQEFLAALVATLDPMHKARREPIHQSLRGGSQTPGRLFGRPDPVIDGTRAALLGAIERRIAALPSDPNHPFLQRKLRSVRFSGSWSVKLWSSGSHVNHIHPEGWMSSAFYVSLPPSVRESDQAEDTAGHIQFGQPPGELGLNLPPRRVVRPVQGHVALFPSYLWHGTVPFEDEEPRITVAFDMTPLA